MSELNKVSVHRGLSELKTLNKRITDAIRSGIFITSNLHSNKKIAGILIDDYKKTVIQASYDKVVSLINRRILIKQAITLSNAGIDVTNEDAVAALKRHNIAGKSLTLAEIIDYDTVIEYKQFFLDELKHQMSSTTIKVSRENDQLPKRVNEYIAVAAAGRDKTNSDDVEFIKNLVEDFEAKNTTDFVDPLGLQKIIEDLQTEIYAFSTEVDTLKSEVNATTFITLPE